ncbi:hypothetical protein CEUSTIGMA_g13714.t1 [Chlamydomonas eustigma]|uniref:Acyl-CoA dehydrogenase/oxidase N-terminal domain-containing protein n=1 Tax=Chlamydomonas eustigma TaxID=1157962 RepID=A0A250XTP9_9CHLO|nr:hypothetical protein CEUSTIGMA_g13714.t1 [Chlamydomonas eustigma]|eukprot:GAX86302.1 hypothetical protein CEUSTIGMA_g13714.t1 [Chlamydomonas eustigma]
MIRNLTALNTFQGLPGCLGVSWLCLSRFSSGRTAEPNGTEEFRESVREFAEKVIAPHAEEIDKTNMFPASRDLWVEMGSFGLLGVTAPLEYGGLAGGYKEHCIAMEDLIHLSRIMVLSSLNMI